MTARWPACSSLAHRCACAALCARRGGCRQAASDSGRVALLLPGRPAAAPAAAGRACQFATSQPAAAAARAAPRLLKQLHQAALAALDQVGDVELRQQQGRTRNVVRLAAHLDFGGAPPRRYVGGGGAQEAGLARAGQLGLWGGHAECGGVQGMRGRAHARGHACRRREAPPAPLTLSSSGSSLHHFVKLLPYLVQKERSCRRSVRTIPQYCSSPPARLRRRRRRRRRPQALHGGGGHGCGLRSPVDFWGGASQGVGAGRVSRVRWVGACARPLGW